MPDHAPLPRAILQKVIWRLVPFLCILYIFNILDRSNVGFARLTMEKDLGMSPAVYDWGIGLFYLGYLLFEVPANLLLRHFGARRWLARIMISWGLVTITTMLVTQPWSFYLVRILLGVAEAGFFPGVIFYLTYWFPARERARVIALFMAAIPISGLLGNPLSGAIMEYCNGLGGYTGWQWLFLLEGLPSVLLGIVTLFYLTDRPMQAHWLSEEERGTLTEHLRAEEEVSHHHEGELFRALLHWRVWLMILVYFPIAVGANTSGAYYPRLIGQQFSDSNKFQIGLLSAMPHLGALLGMTYLGTRSDRTGKHRAHTTFAILLAAAGWALSCLATSPWLVLTGLCIAQVGTMSALPTFWALPTKFLRGVAAAGGIALINSVANLGGLFGPRLFGEVSALGEEMGWAVGNRLGMGAMAALLVVGALLTLGIREQPAPPRAQEA